jgi:nitroimidazol reductase NimA-like FMN-containing flavoprotein (pyridoxamine 5'-phosphate oxidase superfamily)
MRRKDRQITEREQIDAVIRGCTVCHLALAVDNEPYVLPIAFGYDGHSLYIHTAIAGKKIDLMSKNPRVGFAMERNVRLVTSESDPCRFSFAYESVMGSGTVHELEDPRDKCCALDWIMRQYSPGQWRYEPEKLRQVRIWRIAIESLTAKCRRTVQPA